MWLLAALVLLGVGLRDSFLKLWNDVKSHQKQTIRILEGYFGAWKNVTGQQLVMLHIKVDGPPAKIKEWQLTLENDEWNRRGWPVRFEPPILFEEESPLTRIRRAKLIEEKLIAIVPPSQAEQEPVPEMMPENIKRATPKLGELVPAQGWKLFSIPDAGERFGDMVFGARFVLTAIEDTDVKSIGKRNAGEWLRRAIIGSP